MTDAAMTGGAILSPAERAFLSSTRRATLATIAPDGRPRLVPICFVSEAGAGAPVVYSPIDEKPKRSTDPSELARVRDILARPTVTLLVDRWSEDWSELAWLRIAGHATVVGGGESADAAIVAALRAKYAQYADHDLESRPMIRIVIERATSWGVDRS